MECGFSFFLYFWLPSGQMLRAAQSHAKASKEGYDAYRLFPNSHIIQVGLPLSRTGAVSTHLQQMIQKLL